MQVNVKTLFCVGVHVSHLETTDEDELNRLLGIVVDVENLFMCVHREEDADTKQVYFYLFKVRNVHVFYLSRYCCFISGKYERKNKNAVHNTWCCIDQEEDQYY